MDDFLARLAQGLGKNLRGAKRSFDRRIGKTEHPQIVPYRSYGNNAHALVMARALRDPGLTEAAATDNWARNLLNSYKRIETDELPGARARVTWGSISQEITADNDGFLRVLLPLSTPPAPGSGPWHPMRIELIEPRGVQETPPVHAQVLIPPVDAQFGIISDLDDTVIQTGARNVLRMVQATLLGNAHTRVPFEGIAEFYAALQQGATGTAFNPIFYVSSSPWNLYDVIEHFMALHRIPTGPILLRDWGMSLDRIPMAHAPHKIATIREILAMYPGMQFILIGDSGQQDPEIYRNIARHYPGRILCAYIRDVTAGTPRATELDLVMRDMSDAGSRMLVVPDTLAAARDAVKSGWINESALSTYPRPHRD